MKANKKISISSNFSLRNEFWQIILLDLSNHLPLKVNIQIFPKKMKKIITLFFLFSPQLAFASGAYLVDDGGISDPETLQIESWYSRSNSAEDIFVTNPSYQILPNVEFAVQETYTPNGNTLNSLWPQAKYLWFNNEEISTSATLGVNYSSTDQKTYGSYAYSSTTAQLNKFSSLHFYVGWQNWRHSLDNNKSIDFLNYGVGSEIFYDKKLSFVAEYFQANGMLRTGPTRPATQFGARYALYESVLLDGIWGHNINGNNQNWVTVGVTLVFGM